MTLDTKFFLNEDEMEGWSFEETKLDDSVIDKNWNFFKILYFCYYIPKLVYHCLRGHNLLSFVLFLIPFSTKLQSH